MSARRNDLILGTIGTLAVLVLWEAVVRIGLVDAAIFPSPLIAIEAASRRLTGAMLAEHVGWSLMRVSVGFALGAIAGIAVGIAAGWYRLFGAVVRPVIELLRPVPPLAWIPLAIIWFGLGEPSKFFIIFLAAFFPVVTAAYHGVTHVDPALIRAAQTFGLKGLPMLFKVAIPASAPDLATGLRIAWGLAFGILVAAELIAADRGLGFLIMNARNTGGEVGLIITGILIIGVLNLMTDALLGGAIQRWIGRWHGS